MLGLWASRRRLWSRPARASPSRVTASTKTLFACTVSFWRNAPGNRRPQLKFTLLRAERRLAILMLILGISGAVVFGLLRIKYFYALSVFAGLANIVPIIGPVMSVILAGIVENAFLAPRIMKSTLNLPPLAVVIALSWGGALAGVLGALIGVPTPALVAVVLDEYVVRKETTSAEFATSDT
jgi:predicted PurR-regulated permease PerM